MDPVSVATLIGGASDVLTEFGLTGIVLSLAVVSTGIYAFRRIKSAVR